MIEQFALNASPHIELYKLLKILGWVGSGSDAKFVIESGLVHVNGHQELRKRCKLIQGDRITFEQQEVEITTGEPSISHKSRPKLML